MALGADRSVVSTPTTSTVIHPPVPSWSNACLSLGPLEQLESRDAPVGHSDARLISGQASAFVPCGSVWDRASTSIPNHAPFGTLISGSWMVPSKQRSTGNKSVGRQQSPTRTQASSAHIGSALSKSIFSSHHRHSLNLGIGAARHTNRIDTQLLRSSNNDNPDFTPGSSNNLVSRDIITTYTWLLCLLVDPSLHPGLFVPLRCWSNTTIPIP